MGNINEFLKKAQRLSGAKAQGCNNKGRRVVMAQRHRGTKAQGELQCNQGGEEFGLIENFKLSL